MLGATVALCRAIKYAVWLIAHSHLESCPLNAHPRRPELHHYDPQQWSKERTAPLTPKIREVTHQAGASVTVIEHVNQMQDTQAG